jgi:hypothetical protein
MARLPDGRIGFFRLRQRPFAWFRERHDALLTAAVLAARRDPGYRVRAEEDGEGYAVESRAEWGGGWVEQFDPDLAVGLSWADAFMRSPEALALFLEACGQGVLERVGEILAARVRQSAPLFRQSRARFWHASPESLIPGVGPARKRQVTAPKEKSA